MGSAVVMGTVLSVSYRFVTSEFYIVALISKTLELTFLGNRVIGKRIN